MVAKIVQIQIRCLNEENPAPPLCKEECPTSKIKQHISSYWDSWFLSFTIPRMLKTAEVRYTKLNYTDIMSSNQDKGKGKLTIYIFQIKLTKKKKLILLSKYEFLQIGSLACIKLA